MEAIPLSSDLALTAASGALLGGLLCWLFRLQVKLPIVLCIGAFSRCAVSWTMVQAGAPNPATALTDGVMTALVTLALLGVAHLIAAR